MSAIVIDASVWVAATDKSDNFHESSREFLSILIGRNVTVSVPAHAEVEVACALARRYRDPGTGRKVAADVLRSVTPNVHAADEGLLRSAVMIGTALFLRAGDAIYAALASRIGAKLISWDNELVSRAGAVTPEEWLEKQM